jgi:hypothetical protein
MLRHQASRHFRNKKREYLEDKINELARNSVFQIFLLYIPDMSVGFTA